MIEFILFYLIVGLILNIIMAIPFIRSGEYKIDWLLLVLWTPLWPYTLWKYIAGNRE